MGGPGSGGWNRTGRVTAESTTKLSMPELRKCGALRPGVHVIRRWGRGGACSSSIEVHAERDGVHLIYSVSMEDGVPRRVEERVSLERRPCRFGGTRAFFLCPRCARAALNLYLHEGRVLCRCCSRLTYSTRRERERHRHLRAANKLRWRLGGEAGAINTVPSRPRGMWARTYQRLAGEISRREAMATEELAGWLMNRRDPGRRRAGRFW